LPGFGCGNISNTPALCRCIQKSSVLEPLFHSSIPYFFIEVFMMRSISSTTSFYHRCYRLDLLLAFLSNCFLPVPTTICAREKEEHRPWHLGDLPVFRRQQSNFSLSHKNFQVFLRKESFRLHTVFIPFSYRFHTVCISFAYRLHAVCSCFADLHRLEQLATPSFKTQFSPRNHNLIQQLH